MRFETRAMLGFLVLLLLLAAGMVFSIHRMAVVSNERVASVRAVERESRLVERIRWTAELLVANGRGYMLSGEPRLLTQVRETETRFEDGVRALSELDLNEEGRQRVDELDAAADAFHDAFEALLRARRGEEGGARIVAQYEADVYPLRRDFGDAVDRLVEYQRATLVRTYESAAAKQRWARLQGYGFLILLVGVGVALSRFFARQLAGAYAHEQAALDSARRAVAERDQLMEIVAHDLRNPLASVQLNAARLRRGAESERTRRVAETMESTVRRMESLIGSMLDMASFEAGRLTVSPERADASELLHEAAEGIAPLAAVRRVRVDVDWPSAALGVYADRERLQQVLSNLLGNALKFTPSGGSLRLAARRDGDRVRFSVSDSGPGIRSEDLPHVFDRYWKKETGGAKGTGLGLFIARGIVEAHGGRLWVESSWGRGATFHFTLPAAEPPRTELPPVPPVDAHPPA